MTLVPTKNKPLDIEVKKWAEPCAAAKSSRLSIVDSCYVVSRP